MSDASSDRPASSLSDDGDYVFSPASCPLVDPDHGDTNSAFGGFSFTFKHDSKHHPYDVADAPYPLCYDRFILDCDVINVVKQRWSTGQLIYSDNGGVNPTRLLDVGCGTGTWIIEAARKWAETSFVGFDLCPIQPDVELLDDHLGRRISWVHGNFLKTPWPFEDGEFDYIIIRFIAKGVPELSWDSFFQEASRVLASSGHLEYLDEDIIFPHIPDLERLTSDVSSESNETEASLSSSLIPSPHSLPSYEENTEYDEDYLESLYSEVYTERHISLKPTAIIPYYLNIYFQRTAIPARIRIPFPDIPSSRLATNATRLSQQIGDSLHEISGERRESASSDHSGPGPPDTDDQLSSALSNSLSSSAADGQPQVTSESQPCCSRKGMGAVDRVDRESLNDEKNIINGPQDLPSAFRYNVALSLFISAMGVLAVKEAMWERVLVNKGLLAMGPKSKDVQEARGAFDTSLEIFVARLSKFLQHTLEYPFLNDVLQDILRDGKQASGVLDSTSRPESFTRPHSVDTELLSQISSAVLSVIFQQDATAPVPECPLSISASERTRAHSFPSTSSPCILPEYLGCRSSNDALTPFVKSLSEPGRNIIPMTDPLVTVPMCKVSRVCRFFLAAKEVASLPAGFAPPLPRTSSESMASASSSHPSES